MKLFRRRFKLIRLAVLVLIAGNSDNIDSLTRLFSIHQIKTTRYYWVGDIDLHRIHPRDVLFPVMLAQILVIAIATHLQPVSAITFGVIGNLIIAALAMLPVFWRRSI